MRKTLFSILIIFTLFIYSCERAPRRIPQHSINNSNRNSRLKSQSPSTHKNTSVKNLQGKPLSQMYDILKHSVFLVKVDKSSEQYSQGSGFYIHPKGIGVSNYHVFEGGYNATIQTFDGEEYQVQDILEKNEELDYIIFTIKSNKHFPHVAIAKKLPKVGDDVFAIGNPEGLQHTLSTGIVSSYRENNTLIQTTTEITHGSSGGALFNKNGEVIGITTAGLGEANLNFALNITVLKLDRFTKDPHQQR